MTTFNPKEYIENYYPSDFSLLAAHRALCAVRRAFGDSINLDIKNIVKDQNLTHEIVENVAISDFQASVLCRLAATYPRGDAISVDIGAGPTVYQHIAMSLLTCRIFHSELLAKNREEVTHWLDDTQESYNWDLYFLFMHDILSNHPVFQNCLESNLRSDDPKVTSHTQFVKRILDNKNVEEHKNCLRQQLRNSIIPGDVFLRNLGLSQEQMHPNFADIVSSFFAVESATEDKSEWENGMLNITEIVRPGGFLVIASIRNANWFRIGKEKIPAQPVDENHLDNFCRKNELNVLDMRILTGSLKEKTGYDGMVFVLAEKKR
jgi:hypothetical protein